MIEENILEPRHEQYLEWLCTIPSERVPTSKQKYANENHVDIVTLRRWEKRESFRKEWQGRVDTIQGSPQRTQELLDSLYVKALTGDTKSAELWMKATNRLQPPVLSVSSEKRIAELSDSELDELLAAMAVREKLTRARPFAELTS